MESLFRPAAVPLVHLIRTSDWKPPHLRHLPLYNPPLRHVVPLASINKAAGPRFDQKELSIQTHWNKWTWTAEPQAAPQIDVGFLNFTTNSMSSTAMDVRVLRSE